MAKKIPQPFTDKIAETLVNKQLPLWQRPGFLIGFTIIIYLVVGLLVVCQYGGSVDELHRIHYAERSLAAYLSKSNNLQDEKGPFYGMLALLGSKGLVYLFPGWKPIDGWHYMTFVSFVAGVYFFYRLCRRLVDPTPAFSATLLFGTQPILWGHAFINPKDIPFMAFFLASVTLGLQMVDYFRIQTPEPGAKTSIQDKLTFQPQKLAIDWKSAPRSLQRLLIGLVSLLAALALSCKLIHVLIAGLVSQAYAASPASWLGNLFGQIASYASQIPVQAYINKAQVLYSRLAMSAGIGIGLVFVLVAIRVFPSVLGWLFEPRILLAACFLGFCSDIRALGPASGVLVAVYLLSKAGRRAIPILLEYLGVGALTIYLFWPYLWNNPINNFLASLTEASDFPWTGTILFAGHQYPNGNLLPSYLPVLFTLQFTETALVLILTGLIIAGCSIFRKTNLRMDMLLLGTWFAAPVAAAILLHSTVYNNFRQFLFVVPPLFVFASLALQALWDRLRRRAILFIPLVLLALMPALYWDWQLHPYQYVYYNNLVGGVAGASRNYETDYWDITYKEAIEYVNKVASENATVSFWGNYNTASLYARSDLTLMSFSFTPDPGYPFNTLTDYAVISTQLNADLFYFTSSKEIYQVRRGGAVLTVVRQVNKGDLIRGE